MTQREWTACSDPWPMLDFLRLSGRASDRKYQLFVVACCRLVRCLAQLPGYAEALEIAERHADGRATPGELQRACFNLRPAVRRPAVVWLTEAVSGLAWWQELASAQGHAARARREEEAADGEGWASALREQAEALRDVYDPFGPASLDHAWLTRDVVALAAAADGDRHMPPGRLDRDHLAVLADALEDAGCQDAELLGHLRSAGPHWRGCWAVDLVLRRE